MYEANSPAEAASLLRSSCARLVAVDGAHGSGKSHLAGELGALLEMEVVHLDDFVARNQREYVQHIDFSSVSAALAVGGALIVEGICVLQILDRLGMEPDAFVYVKRVAHGYWLDEDHFDPQMPIEDHLAGIRESIRPLAEMLGESGELGLAEEVIRYHAEYRPHERATIVFLRNDS